MAKDDSLGRVSPLFSWRTAIVKSELPSTTKLVALVLSLYMSELGEGCFPAYATLGKRASLSRRRTYEHVGKLVEQGWLEKTERPGETNLYSSRVPEQGGRSVPPEAEQGGTERPPGGDGASGGVGTERPPTALTTATGTAAGADELSRRREARDPIWDVLGEIFGEPTTGPEKTNRGRQTREIRVALGLSGIVIAAGKLVEPDYSLVRAVVEVSIRSRCRALAKHWDDPRKVTANALVSNWTLATRLVETGRADVPNVPSPPCEECGVGGGFHSDDCTKKGEAA